MNCKSLLLAIFLIFASAIFAQNKVSILGGSYSTFHSYVTPDEDVSKL